MVNRSISGARAKLQGEEFENMLRHPAARLGAELIRLPDGCRMVRRGRAVVAQRIATPYDFVLVKGGLGVAFFDAKSVAGASFCYSAIAPHQLEALLRVEAQGYPAGYVVYHRAADMVCFYSAKQLRALRRGESLRAEQGRLLGGLLSFDFSRIFI